MKNGAKVVQKFGLCKKTQEKNEKKVKKISGNACGDEKKAVILHAERRKILQWRGRDTREPRNETSKGVGRHLRTRNETSKGAGETPANPKETVANPKRNGKNITEKPEPPRKEVGVLIII